MSLFADAKIRTKVIVAFTLVLVVTLVLGIFAADRLSALGDVATEIRTTWLPGTRDLGVLAAAAERYRLHSTEILMTDDPEYQEEHEKKVAADVAEYEQAWNDYRPIVPPGPATIMAETIAGNWRDMRAINERVIELVRSKQKSQAVALFAGDDLKAFSLLRANLKKSAETAAAAGQAKAADGEAVFVAGRLWIYGAAALAAVLCAVAGTLIVSGVSRPIQQLTDAMTRLAGHDLATPVEGAERADELGAMARAVRVFRDSMQEGDRLAAAQRQETAQKEARQRRIDEGIRAFERSISELLAELVSGAAEMNATASGMSTIAEQTGRQAATVAASSEEASNAVATVAAACEEMSASIEEISRQVTQSAEIARDAVAEAARTGTAMRGLADMAHKIGEVVALINDIAGQTNLLALNATIEAARAGEAGKGFAVVASEVKALANQTGRATEDISAQVGAIQQATRDAVAAIQSIDGTIMRVSEIAAAIASAVEEQGAATREITRNTQEASRGTQDVSRNIGGVNDAAIETGRAATRVLSAAERLNRHSDALRASVADFLAGIRAA